MTLINNYDSNVIADSTNIDCRRRLGKETPLDSGIKGSYEGYLSIQIGRD